MRVSNHAPEPTPTTRLLRRIRRPAPPNLRRALTGARLLAALVGLCALAQHASAQGPLAFRPELHEVTKRADLAFLGYVSSVREEAPPEVDMAFTHVTFRVEQVLFDRTSSAPHDVITLVFAGGKRGAETIQVFGVPEFRLGEEVVVLTYYDGERYASPVVGRSAGLFRVLEDEHTHARYPLTADGAGIAAVRKGSLVLADRVQGMRSGRPIYAENAVVELAAGPPAPQPVVGSGEALSATPSRLPPSRPSRLVELQPFLDSIDTLYRELPAGRK